MIPGIQEARKVEGMIERLGVQDVKLLFDNQLNMWGVYQVRKKASTFILPQEYQQMEQYLMWWCKDKDSKYRAPSEQDVHDVIATVHRAQKWFQKGGEALADELDRQDAQRQVAKEEKLKDRLQPHVKRLKRAIREELG